MTVQSNTTEHKHSPMQLRVLLHHYYSPANWSEEHRSCEAAGDATRYWLENGCLEERDDGDHDSGFYVTERGLAMVEAWLSAPLPDAPLPDAPVRSKVTGQAPLVFNLPAGTSLVFNIGGQDE